jgi:hypothetical protein
LPLMVLVLVVWAWQFACSSALSVQPEHRVVTAGI